MIYNIQYFCNLQKIFTPFRKKQNNGNKNNKKTFSIKMNEDVGT